MKFTLAIIASLAASASAFAPSASSSVKSTALNGVDVTKAVGVQAPLGVFDPLGLLGDDKTNVDEESLENLRWAELKHGRVAMLAVVGYLVTYAGVRFPGAENIPAGFAALDNLPGMVWAQMIATWTLMEAANQDQFQAPWGTGSAQGKPSPAEFKGDFRNGFLDFGWDSQSEEWKKNKRQIEINNGRAAQMGILGIMIHDKLGNLDAILPPPGH